MGSGWAWRADNGLNRRLSNLDQAETQNFDTLKRPINPLTALKRLRWPKVHAYRPLVYAKKKKLGDHFPSYRFHNGSYYLPFCKGNDMIYITINNG